MPQSTALPPMYFWRIEKLKSEMAARPLSEREILPYLVTLAALSAAASYSPITEFNRWDGLGMAWSIVLAVVGTIYIYNQNGGAGGQYFLPRYLAVGWVVGVRCLAAIVIAAVVTLGVMEIAGVLTDSTSCYEFVLFAAAETIVYWRIGHHIRDLANKAHGGSPRVEP